MAACNAYWAPRADTPSQGDRRTPGDNGRRVGWGLRGSWRPHATFIEAIKTWEGR